jgi:hypothetical protein
MRCGYGLVYGEKNAKSVNDTKNTKENETCLTAARLEARKVGMLSSNGNSC